MKRRNECSDHLVGLLLDSTELLRCIEVHDVRLPVHQCLQRPQFRAGYSTHALNAAQASEKGWTVGLHAAASGSSKFP